MREPFALLCKISRGMGLWWADDWSKEENEILESLLNSVHKAQALEVRCEELRVKVGRASLYLKTLGQNFHGYMNADETKELCDLIAELERGPEFTKEKK